MKAELWKSVPGFEGSYEVSDQGRVRSLSRYIFRLGRGGELHSVYRPAKLMTPRLWGDYLAVTLSGPSKKHFYSIHRLVAITFLGHSEQVNHKNEDKLDNRLQNLELCDGSYNQCYSKGKSLLFQSPDGQLISIRGIRVAGRLLPISRSSIRNLMLGLSESCKGWRLLKSNA